jgi:ABC-type transport system substrate-binding protein
MKSRVALNLIWALSLCSLNACDSSPWNDPYPASEAIKNIRYTSFDERPKHLDPAISYSANETVFTSQIYEPPLQYHYLKRPYTLEPLAAAAYPITYFLDRYGRRLDAEADDQQVVYSVYEIHIKPGIYYQPHPAFAKNANGKFLYHALKPEDLDKINTLVDFVQSDTKELVAADYVYQIKRLAHPALHSPILGLMGGYIIGLSEYARMLESVYKNKQRKGYLDLEQYPLEGAQVVDRYTYRVMIRGKYPQFMYWLAMPFFSPIPAEVERFYAQPGMQEKNFNLDWYPVGTGPYMLTVNDPNRQMVLERNPHYHADYYPDEGEQGDREEGLLEDAGRRLPFIDKALFSLEKEDIPRWNKFLQGYYDASGVTSDTFDSAVNLSSGGEASLTEEMRAKGIRLVTTVEPSIYFMGFNMLDPVVGGYSEKNRKLRLAISIAVDYEEFLSIFRNNRGVVAQGPIPPGVFGYRQGQEGLNPYIFNWMEGKPRRKSIETAHRLLAEAGYPNGVNQATGEPLVIYFDTVDGGVDTKSYQDWLRKQFRKLNVQLIVRGTDYNRFQEKMRKGNSQMFQWGWNADYPDPENFLFLLYGPNRKAGLNGENATNYSHPGYDRLFKEMQHMENGPRRQAIIDRMLEIAQRDAPWIWGFYPKSYVLSHAWNYNSKPNLIANNLLKYQRVDPVLRNEKRAEWNRPVLWPMVMLAVLVTLGVVPAVRAYWRSEHKSAK